jgi:hypothetical protein
MGIRVPGGRRKEEGSTMKNERMKCLCMAATDAIAIDQTNVDARRHHLVSSMSG